jgi:hypothetical protein
MTRFATKHKSPDRVGFPARFAARLLGVLLVASQTFAAPVVLFLRNGDRISGEWVRETEDRLVLKSPFAGELSIRKSDISRREPAASTNGVSTPAPSSASLPKAAATTPPTAVSPPKTNAPVLVAPKGFRELDWVRAFLTNWHGNVGLGMNLGFGTTDRQTFFVNANAVHTWQRVVNNISYNAAYGFVNQVEAANRMDGVFKTDVFVGPRKKLYTYNQMLGGYDEVRQIRLRWEEGVGMGYKVYDRNQLAISGEVGGQYQKFSYSNEPDRSIWSARFGETLAWKPTDKFQITQRMHFMPNVSDLSDYHARFELIASYPLFKKLTVSLNLADEYESRPAHGVDNNDLQITTNINVVF